jgi:hypothetical protein
VARASSRDRTLVNSVEKDAMAAKGLLRHATVVTTQKHYIKEVPETARKASGGKDRNLVHQSCNCGNK